MDDTAADARGLYVLVGGWPGSGKSTLAAALAAHLQLPLLAKDEIKEALADAVGRPADVPVSQRLGRAAVQVMLRVAARCPSAVLDSTWFPGRRAARGDLKARTIFWCPFWQQTHRSVRCEARQEKITPGTTAT